MDIEVKRMSPTAVEMLDQPEATICPPKKFECCGQCSTTSPDRKVWGFFCCGGAERKQDKQRQGITVAVVSCLLL